MPFRYDLLLMALGELTGPRETVADESRSCSSESDLSVSDSLNKYNPLCLMGANQQSCIKYLSGKVGGK